MRGFHSFSFPRACDSSPVWRGLMNGLCCLIKWCSVNINFYDAFDIKGLKACNSAKQRTGRNERFAVDDCRNDLKCLHKTFFALAVFFFFFGENVMNSRQFSNKFNCWSRMTQEIRKLSKKRRWARNDANKRAEVKKVTETRAQTDRVSHTALDKNVKLDFERCFFERRKMQISPTIPNGVKAQNRVSTRSFWIRRGFDARNSTSESYAAFYYNTTVIYIHWQSSDTLASAH